MDMGISRKSRADAILLIVAGIFHLVGIAGIALHQKWIARSTPAHLLLMLAMLLYSFRHRIRSFAAWSAAIAVMCFAAEWLGVHYGWLFGAYRYGNALGPKWLDIPQLIGVNWVLVAAGAISLAGKLRLPEWLSAATAATIATGYDWVLEPVAMRLGYWNWEGGRIPPYNYICWWGLTALSALLWQRACLRGNLFSRGLFLMQIIFFILLRLLL